MEQNTERAGQAPGATGAPGVGPVAYESGKGCLMLTLMVAGVLGLMVLSVVLLGDPNPTPGAVG